MVQAQRGPKHLGRVGKSPSISHLIYKKEINAQTHDLCAPMLLHPVVVQLALP